jgi:predicted DNA-binding transcriptional regulator AlpA
MNNDIQDEIWTVDDVASYLKMTPNAVYDLTRRRGQERSAVPLPVVRIHSKALRFKKSAVIAWFDSLSK